MALRFDHVGILSETPQQNADIASFFREVLGASIDGEPTDGYAEVRLGDAVIALHVGSRTALTPHGGTLLHLVSDDVDADVAAVEDRGGRIVAPPEDMPWGRSAYVAGPHGVLVEMYRP